MKTTILALLVLLLASPLFSQTNTFKLGFTGAYPNYYNYDVTWGIDWSHYNEMNVNTWQGWWVGDTAASIFTKLNSNHMDGYFQPDTLLWAGFGRVQVNEAEDNSSLQFRYVNHYCGSNYQDNTAYGYGQYVRYFNKNDNCLDSPSGIVLSGANENCMQTITGLTYDPLYQAPFPYNNGTAGGTRYLNNYYLKPKMRIDSADADGTTKNVARIIVKAYNGDIVDSVTITTDNFKDSHGNYDGKYIEEFNLPQLVVTADSLNRGRPDANPLSMGSCYVDYQIYWYGTVSFYIDYVKIMDQAAFQLFSTDPLINKDSTIAQKVRRIKALDTEHSMRGFYMEEVDYSNLACLKKMN